MDFLARLRGEGMIERTRDALNRAGWSPDRRADIGETVAVLEADGYWVDEELRIFLSEYVGLVIEFVREKDDDTISFDVRRVCGGV